jgi:hypothetical protein
VGLRFKGKNLAVYATWFGMEGPDGTFRLCSVLEKPAGNFMLNLPAGLLPVAKELKIPGTEPAVDRLNDIAELGFMIHEQFWTCSEMTIHELRGEGDRLFARITLGLRAGFRTEPETAVLTLKSEKIAVHSQEELEKLASETSDAREDTFDLSNGLGRLRWSDTREILEPGAAGAATWRGAGSGKGLDGKEVKWGAGLEIPTFLMIFKGDSANTLWFSAFVEFGKNKKVSAVTLHPYPSGDGGDHISEMLSWIGERTGNAEARQWGIPEGDPRRPKKQEWTKQDVHFEVASEGSSFNLKITPPRTAVERD